MNPTAFYTTIGILVNAVLARVLGEIEDQADISEEESTRLNSLCKILHGLENLFMTEGEESVSLPKLRSCLSPEGRLMSLLPSVLRWARGTRLVQIRLPLRAPRSIHGALPSL